MSLEAIHRLKSIAAFADKNTSEAINQWINDHIGQVSIEIVEALPSYEEHRVFQLQNAKHKLGESIAEQANMFPSFVKDGKYLKCRMTALFFKDSPARIVTGKQSRHSAL